MAKNNTIKCHVNQGYYGLDENDDAYEEILNKQKLLKGISGCSLMLTPGTKEYARFCPVSFFKEDWKEKEPKLVYQVAKQGELYYLKTGLFIGHLTVNKNRIFIDSGYKPFFLEHMLKYASDIFFDDDTEDSVKDNDDPENFMSFILQYLFIINLKRAFSMGLPSEYTMITEHGFNVKGQLNIKDYIQKDVMYKYKLTYAYRKRQYVQSVIDILYTALKILDDDISSRRLLEKSDMAKVYRTLRQLYSCQYPTSRMMNEVAKDRSLNNPMYSRYKRALEYAVMLINRKNVVYDENSDSKGDSGMLINIAELWELYLTSLLKRRFGERFSVCPQSEISIYPESFFKRSNYPDIVMESDDTRVVLDAKFKNMRFISKDVDRNDLHQIHSYAGYYVLKAQKENKKLKLCSLVYPTKDDSNKQMVFSFFFFNGDHFVSDVKFAISYLKIPDNKSEMKNEEESFLNRLEEIIAINN